MKNMSVFFGFSVQLLQKSEKFVPQFHIFKCSAIFKCDGGGLLLFSSTHLHAQVLSLASHNHALVG